MTEPDKKRRLPIVSQPSSPETPPDEDRPPWHWSGFGVVATFLVWLPLAALAAKRAASLAGDPGDVSVAVRIELVGLQLLAFVIAVFAGGFFVGRFGGKAGAREGASSGFVTAAIAWALTAASFGGAGPPARYWAALLLVLGGLGAATGFAGGYVGVRLRHPAERM